jgi:Sec-independent protein translocase protein TatA
MKINEIADNFSMTPEQRKLAALGRTLMDAAATTKDDALSNVMAKVGNELTNYGGMFGASNLKELVKKTGVSVEVIKKLLDYAEKIHSAHSNLKADHKDSGLDDTDDDDNDFIEPDDDEMARKADRAARGK